MTNETSLRVELLEKIQALLTAGLGLVAALAWNDAIQALFSYLFGTQSSIVAKFFYALLITILVVVLTVRISQLLNRLKEGRQNGEST